MKTVVVTARTFDDWDERGVILSRLTGALACLGAVDVLSAGGPERGTRTDGAAQRHVFPSTPAAASRRRALEALTFGPHRPRADCGCLSNGRASLAGDAGADLECELISLQAGTSPELIQHLQTADFDLAVFVGAQDMTTVAGLEVLGGRIPTIALPLAVDDPVLGLNRVRAGLEAADAVAVTTSAEGRTVRRHAPNARVSFIGSVLRVHELALKNEPLLFEKTPGIIVATDWKLTPPADELLLTVRRLNRDLNGRVIVRLVGPGWEVLPDDVRAPHADSRFDVWRWVVRSLALWDPSPNRILAREVLEALQYGTPVIASWSGAAREHAEIGNGGLWYRTYDELLAAIEFLLVEEDARKTLGGQGRSYARAEFGDTDAYIERVLSLVQSVMT